MKGILRHCSCAWHFVIFCSNYPLNSQTLAVAMPATYFFNLFSLCIVLITFLILQYLRFLMKFLTL